jgi:hypothetical protein
MEARRKGAERRSPFAMPAQPTADRQTPLIRICQTEARRPGDGRAGDQTASSGRQSNPPKASSHGHRTTKIRGTPLWEAIVPSRVSTSVSLRRTHSMPAPLLRTAPRSFVVCRQPSRANKRSFYIISHDSSHSLAHSFFSSKQRGHTITELVSHTLDHRSLLLAPSLY